MRAAVAIMRDTEGYFDLLNKIQNNSAGFAEEVVGKRMETLAGKIDIVQSAAENLMTTFSEALGKNPIIMGFLDMVGWAISQLRDLMATPFGPWIAGFAAIAAVGLKVGSIWMGLRARWLLLNGDSQVSFKTMIRLMMGGWSQATMSAQGYLNMERAIIAQGRLVSEQVRLPLQVWLDYQVISIMVIFQQKWELMADIMLKLVGELLDGLLCRLQW